MDTKHICYFYHQLILLAQYCSIVRVKLVGVAGVVSSCCNLVAACFACIFMPYLVRFFIVFLLWIMSGSVSVGEEGARSFGFLWSIACASSVIVVCLLFE